MSTIIETRNLVKKYGGLEAVRGLNLNVPEGAIYGFVGPNGAGKTTTMRILTTLMRPSSGEAFVAGYSVSEQPRNVRRAIGYMPDFFGVYDDMKVWEYLDFFAACYDIPERERGTLVDDLLELVDLSHRKNDMVDKLSRGMKQRLCLARTLAHDPQVLILDEPASGLDPRARIEIRELLVELASMGKSIFFSSHILADVSEICTHIGIIEAGVMVAQGSMDEMRRQLMPHREITITFLNREDLDRAQSLIGGIEGVLEMAEINASDKGRPRLKLHFSGEDEGVALISRRLSDEGIAIVGFSEEERDLEAVFMRATKGLVT
ncbi:MAG: ABC transporter ATP-binding protein [Anaerolineae bacterium]|nr:ABC transporter ATP-binding protein [Anaerolineae bacterium]